MVVLTGVWVLFGACSKDKDERDDFVGTWSTQETFTFGQVFTYNYNFTITKSTAEANKILLNGFGDESGVTLQAIVSGRSFTIPQQTIVIDAESMGVSGSGTRDGNRLTYSYTLTTLEFSINISGTATRL